MSVHVCACLCVCAYVCVCMSVCVCLRVSVCMYASVCLCLSTLLCFRPSVPLVLSFSLGYVGVCVFSACGRLIVCVSVCDWRYFFSPKVHLGSTCCSLLLSVSEREIVWEWMGLPSQLGVSPPVCGSPPSLAGRLAWLQAGGRSSESQPGRWLVTCRSLVQQLV